MGTRQYIGARYVPKFAEPIDWNSQTTYEGLTIVNYLGASYTSKKPVPAGIVPTNTDYWVKTGDYNAQIETYRQEVEEYKEEVDTYKGNRIIFVGDSYAFRPTTSDAWLAKVVSALGLTEGNYYNVCAEGAGFCREGNSFLGNLTNRSDTIADHNGIGRICVIGGYNDFNVTTATIVTAMAEFIAYCKQEYPNAKVSIACVGVNKSHPTYAGNLINAVIPAYRQAPTYGAEYWNLEGVLHDTSYIQDIDGFHPTAAGGTALARGIVNCILGTNFFAENNNRITTVKTGFTGDGLAYKEYFQNGILMLEGFNQPTYTCNVSISGGSIALEIWELENSRMFGDGIGAAGGIPVETFVQYTKSDVTHNVWKPAFISQEYGSHTLKLNMDFDDTDVGGTLLRVIVNKNWHYVCEQMAI